MAEAQTARKHCLETLSNGILDLLDGIFLEWMVSNMTKVLYCYRCGKHVPREGDRCWYCAAETNRTIRPPRHCPFCDEEIGRNAVKCPHCQEFLDGRPPKTAADSPGPVQVFYIDKAIIQGEQPLMLEAGAPIPPEIAGRLTNRTLQAIQSNQPQLIDQEGIRALPAPANAATGGSGQIVRSETLHAPASLPPDIETQAVARRESIPEIEARPAKKETPKPSDPDVEKYRDCPHCQTEVLRTDNYCFHCGILLREDKARVIRGGARHFSQLPLILCATACSAGLFLLPTPDGAASPLLIVYLALLVLAPILLAVAFFRQRSSINQVMVLIALAAFLIGAGRVLLARIFF